MALSPIQQLIQILEQRQLLPAAVMSKVTRHAEKDPKADPVAIAKWLISQGHLTKQQARDILSGITVAKKSGSQKSSSSGKSDKSGTATKPEAKPDTTADGLLDLSDEAAPMSKEEADALRLEPLPGEVFDDVSRTHSNRTSAPLIDELPPLDRGNPYSARDDDAPLEVPDDDLLEVPADIAPGSPPPQSTPEPTLSFDDEAPLEIPQDEPAPTLRDEKPAEKEAPKQAASSAPTAKLPPIDLLDGDSPPKPTPPPTQTSSSKAPTSNQSTPQPSAEKSQSSSKSKSSGGKKSKANKSESKQQAKQKADKEDDLLELEPEPETADSGSSYKSASEREADLLAAEDDLLTMDDVAPADGGFGNSFDDVLGDSDEALGPPQPKLKASVWDSSLLLLGGGGLLLLLIIGGALYWSIGRQSGDDALKAAEDDYNSGSYSQAIHKYDRYLERFPQHVGTSTARVHRGLARMRQLVDAGGDWGRVHDETNEVIEEIRQEEAFAENRAELAAMLPTVAQKLADQARDKQDRGLVEKARKTLETARNPRYVPTDLQRTQIYSDIESSLALVERELDREMKLKEAIQQIAAAASSGDTSAAYGIRKDLLQTYPNLITSVPLQDAIRGVAAAEQAKVQFQAQARQAITEPREDPVTASLTPVVRQEGSAPNVNDRQCFALIDGTVYALDAASGKVLWRKFLGFECQFAPVSVSGGGAADVLLLDVDHQELQRVNAANGELKWRLPVEDRPGAAPLVTRSRALLPTQSGKLIEVELDSGNSPGFYQFPQALRVPPVVDSQGQFLFQFGEHSNLYVIALAEARCESVFYVGHDPGTISAPPVMVGDFLVAAENYGLTDSRLRVLQRDEETKAVVERLATTPITGHIHTEPLVSGRTLVVTTDLGAVQVFDVQRADKPLTSQAAMAATYEQPVAGFPLLRSANLWMADRGLTLYEIQVAGSRLVPKWRKAETDVCLSPPQLINNVLVFVHRPNASPGAMVTAYDSLKGTPYWEVQLANPMASQLQHDQARDRLFALQTTGHVFAAGSKDFAQPEGLNEQSELAPLQGTKLATPWLTATAGQVDADRWIFSTSDVPALVNFAADRDAVQLMTLQGEPTARPLAFPGGVIVAGALGQVTLIDPGDGNMKAFPYQPPVENDSRIEWQLTGLPGGDEGPQILATNNLRNLYRLQLRNEPSAQLSSAASGTLEAAVVGPLAVLDPLVYTVDTRDQLLAIDAWQLQPRAEWELGGPPQWGPARVGDQVLVVRTDGTLACFDKQAALLWEVPLPPYAELAAACSLDDSLIVSISSGWLWKIDPRSGQVLAKLQLPEPLGRGLIASNEDLIATDYQGNWLLIPLAKLTSGT